MAQGLLVVEGEVLGGGNDVLGLGAANRFPRQGPGQQRVLAEVFEVAPVARIAGQVGAAGQHHVQPLAVRLAADHRARLERQLGIEGGGHGLAGGQRNAAVVGPDVGRVGDPQAGVAFLQRRHAEPRDAGDVAGRAHRAGRHGAEERQRHGPVQEAVALLVGHLLFDHPGPLIRIQLRVHPGPGRLGRRGERQSPQPRPDRRTLGPHRCSPVARREFKASVITLSTAGPQKEMQAALVTSNTDSWWKRRL